MKNEIPLNPDLSEDFFYIAMGNRPKEEVKEWFDKPFITSVYNGNNKEILKYNVYCLDDGLKDSPTCHADFVSFEEAEKTAHEILENIG